MVKTKMVKEKAENFVRLVLTDSDHAQLRIEAAKAGQSMATYVKTMVENHLAKRREAK